MNKLTEKELKSDMKNLGLEASTITIGEDESDIRVSRALDGENVKQQ